MAKEKSHELPRTHVRRVDVPQVIGITLTVGQRTLLSEVSSTLSQDPEVILSELVSSSLLTLYRLLVKSSMYEDIHTKSEEEERDV